MEQFRFRLNCIDHYQAKPTDCDPPLRRRPGPMQRHNAPQVPVIRVFGATETGQKVCAHIHGALPYLYLEYHGSLETEAVNEYIASLRASIDHALANTYRRNAYDGKAVYVGHISLVKGVPFYGYNVGYKVFLKVYLLNPVYMTRFADLLYQGAILNRIFQPYESHLQYLLQWMCDYNLYGCGYIDCSKVQFRGPVPDSDEIDTELHKWHTESIPPDAITDSDQYPRQSHCTLEVDICVQDILNRHEVQPRPIHHDFLERFKQPGPDDRFVPSMAGLWRDETRRRKMRMGMTDPSSSPFPADVLVSMSADVTDTSSEWIHEEEYRELMENLVHEESLQGPSPTFDTFVKEVEGLEHIKTAMESIEDLYPCNLQPQTPEKENMAVDIGAINDTIPDNLADDLPSDDPEVGATVPGDDDIDKGDEGYQSNGEDEQALDPLSVLESSFREGISDEDLLGAIDSHGGASGHEAGSSQALRKRQHDLRHEDHPSKRQRVLAFPSQNSSHRVSFREEVAQETSQHADNASQSEWDDDLPRGSQASQATIKASGLSAPSSFAFPVVKNANDPETVLRLSQSEYSNSQDFPKTPMQKLSQSQLTKGTPISPWSHEKTSFATLPQSSPRADAAVMALLSGFEKTFDHTSPTCYYAQLPPSVEELQSTMGDWGLPPVLYKDAFYGNEKDVPDRPREYAGREFKLQSTTLPYLPVFDSTGASSASWGEQPAVVVDKSKNDSLNRYRAQRCSLRNWEISTAPPSFEAVSKWLQRQPKVENDKSAPTRKPVLPELSQVDGPTQKNKHGFKYSQRERTTSVKEETQYMSILSVEVHVNSRGSLVPDPAEDEIQAVFWTILGEENGVDGRPRAGVLVLSDEDGIVQGIAKQVSIEVEHEEDELELINRLVDIVRQFDPDILTGYEVHNGSWGYLIERARMKYEFDLCEEFSKMKAQSNGRFGKDADRWGFTHTSTIRVTGRHMINIWRAMRGELNLLQYTMENVVFHLLHKRIPHYSYADLTAWYQSPKPRDLAKVLEYFISRVKLNLDILEANEIVPRTSEQARLLGVDFFSVISRGSQFKVESTMFRIAKPENFILPSPSRKQVGQQNALECLPLVMEPQSAFYTSPAVVLDFQSLYPSVMIAYNYCYSTCLGRIVNFRGRNKMGFMDFERSPQLLALVKDHVNIAPNGMMYVRPSLRKSLLAKMLGELLETRVMVKSGMKADRDDKSLQQLLNNRQLALKLLANVTYGYTSASFSGRMPCSEIADSIVQTGRETLEKAIALIHANQKWDAEVVYGDTDSLFIHLKGRSKDQAFAIGAEIAAAVTATNPRPIKLKFEKVYHPCVLLAKKRYVGFKYESPSQSEPDFDAKGIETVRRDGTPAEQKIEERALKILFRTHDLSQVKAYFQEQCRKIMTGRVSIQDFLFAKEVKLGTYSDRGPPPPGAMIATKKMLADRRAEPQYGERVPYVVVTGAPGARLIDRCVEPETLLKNEGIELDAEYYINKNLIPPLERIFCLVGGSVKGWFDEMPKVKTMRNISIPVAPSGGGNAFSMMGGGIGGKGEGKIQKKTTLESYMRSSHCLLCRARLPPPPPAPSFWAPHDPNLPPPFLTDTLPLCSKCLVRPARALLTLKGRIRQAEERLQNVESVCRSCTGLPWGEEIKCDSRDCPVFYTRVKENTKLKALREKTEWVVEGLEGLEW